MKFVASLFACEAVDEPLKRALAELRDPHANGRNSHVPRQRDVIKTHDSDLFGDFLARCAKRLQRTDRHVVVSGKDCVKLDSIANELSDRRVTGFGLEIAPNDMAVETVRRDFPPKGRFALLGVDVIDWAADVDDMSPPE
jgi:hypothetical protein